MMIFQNFVKEFFPAPFKWAKPVFKNRRFDELLLFAESNAVLPAHKAEA